MLVFDYNKAMRLVRELRQIATDMNNLKNGMLSQAIGGVQGGWQGETAQQFITKCNRLSSLISGEVNNIRNVANSLETTSDAIDKAEREAAEKLAHVLTGGLL